MNTRTTLQIYLLGPFEVFLNGNPLSNQEWQSQQARTIFKILLERRGKVVPSDQLIDTLWPEEEPDSARRRLHVRISQLRHALQEFKSLVRTVDGGYLFSLNEEIWVDIDKFQGAFAEGSQFQESEQHLEAITAFERARQLYRGDFLAEDLYADWTFSKREYYSERFITLLSELAECYAQQGRYRLAIARCQDALIHDPLRETIYVRLMLYHYYAGDRSQSLLTYDRLCNILANELAIDPLKSTVTIVKQIRDGTLWTYDDAPRYPPPIYEGRLFEVPFALSEMPFVGRDREYAWLIEQRRNPKNRVILLKGEAGIGKSRLLNEFIGNITTRGDTVLSSKISSGKHSPLIPVISAVQSLIKQRNLRGLSPATLSALYPLFPQIHEWAGYLPELPELSPVGEQNRLFNAIEELITASLTDRTLLIVDDAHRIGLSACKLLARISNSIQVLLSYRSEETPPDHPIQLVFQATPAALDLKPLQPKDIQKLVQEMSNNEFPNLVAEIGNQAEGNPFFIVTLLQHMFDEGQLYVNAGGGWGLTNYEVKSLPQSIRETIEKRLQRLNRSQRRVFDFAAVLGGEFDFYLLQQATQQPEDSLLTIIDELIDKALIIEPRASGQAEFSISHDRYAEVAQGTLPKIRQKQLHLQAARAIELIHADTLSAHYPSLAEHFRKAEITEKECFYATLAGKQAAAQFANNSALRFLSRALELTSDNEVEQRYQLLLAREKVFDLLGDRPSQKVDLDHLALLANGLASRQQAEIFLRQAAYDWIVGDDVSAFANLEKSISLAQSCGAMEIEAASYLLRGRGELDQTKARQYLEKARTLAKQDGLRVMEGDIVRALGNTCFWQNSYVESQTYYEEALSIHREVGDLRGELSGLNNLGHLSQLIGDPKNAGNFFEEGLEICSKIGDRLAEGVLLANLGGLMVDLGEYDQVVHLLQRACEIREEIKNEEGVGLLLPTLGDTLRRQGKFTKAKVQLERALEINTRIQHPPQECLSLDALLMLYCELGDYAVALDYFERALDVLTDESSPNRVRALANGCLLHHLMGNNGIASDIGEKALSLSEDFPQIRATALTNLGFVRIDTHKFDEAEKEFRRALELRKELMQPHLAVEPLAGLAQIALTQNNLQDALVSVETIFGEIEKKPHEGPDRLFTIYLTCYQVFAACDDPRAQKILETAYDLLQKRANQIEEDDLLQSYLENVQTNKMINILRCENQIKCNAACRLK